MATNFSDAITSSTLDIFQTMLGMEATVGKLLEAGECTELKYDVSGIIGLAGGCVGAISVRMNQDVAMKITAGMLGMDVTEMSAEVEDCVGELGNMVAGGAKTVLAGNGIDFDISLPTVIVGCQHSTSQNIEGGTKGAIFINIDGAHIVVEYMIKQIVA